MRVEKRENGYFFVCDFCDKEKEDKKYED